MLAHKARRHLTTPAKPENVPATHFFITFVDYHIVSIALVHFKRNVIAGHVSDEAPRI